MEDSVLRPLFVRAYEVIAHIRQLDVREATRSVLPHTLQAVSSRVLTCVCADDRVAFRVVFGV